MIGIVFVKKKLKLSSFLATTRRVRPGQQDTKSTRRRHNTNTSRKKNSTVRRGSQYHEVQVAMLPDLSGNEKENP